MTTLNILNNFKSDFVNFCSDRNQFSPFLQDYRDSSSGIIKSCEKAFIRKRLFPFFELLAFLLMPKGKTTTLELIQFFHGKGGPHQTVSKSVICRQRKFIKSDVFVFLNRKLLDRFYLQGNPKRHGHGFLMAVDGTNVSLPYFVSYDEKEVPEPKGTQVPQMRLVMVYDILNNLFVAAVLVPISIGEKEAYLELLDSIPSIIKEDSVFIFDRNYQGHRFFQTLMMKGIKFIIRLTKAYKKVYDAFEKAKVNLIDVSLTSNYTARKYHQVPTGDKPIYLHAERRMLENGESEVCVSNISDDNLRRESITGLYKLRWTEETAIGRYKNEEQAEIFSSYSMNGIKQDLFAKLLAYNITSLLVTAAGDDLKKSRGNGLVSSNGAADKGWKEEINFNVAVGMVASCFSEWIHGKSTAEILTKIVKFIEKCVEYIQLARHFPRLFRSIKRYGKYQTYPNYKEAL